MLRKVFSKDYLFYGSSIVIGRGLEYVVLFFAANYLSKTNYGDLEFYKKVIEVGSSVLAFGFPALLLSYTKSEESKDYFYFLMMMLVMGIGVTVSIFFGFFNFLFLLIPFLFYACYFTGGITQAYILVTKGSSAVSKYKIIISVLFYGIVFLSIYYFNVTSYAYVYVNYILFPFFGIYSIFLFYRKKIQLSKLKKYWRLLKKLLYGSFTLVISNFANLMFLYTDIFIIKLFSSQSSVDIANYSFALNVGGLLLLIPMTLVQVDIEKLKNDYGYVGILNKRILLLIATSAIAVVILFYVLTEFVITAYKNIFILFLIILLAKVIQAMSPLYGTMLIVFKKYNVNLTINISTLLLNILLSYVLFKFMNIYGVALSSVICLIVRYLWLLAEFKKQEKTFLYKN